MNKKFISLILTGLVCSSVLVSCGNNNTSSASSNSSVESSQSTDENKGEVEFKPTSPSDVDPNEKRNADSHIMGHEEGNTNINTIVKISDLKGKDAKSINKLLGEPTATNDNTSTYEKDNCTFEITYFNSICGKIKVTPKEEYKFPLDGANLLKLFGITPESSDSCNPKSMTWTNKFDTYSIDIYADLNKIEEGKVADKVGYIEVILDEQYK